MTTHFIGIGGIGMSALASVLLQDNQKVSGSDKASSDITNKLMKMSADICIGHDKTDFTDTKLVVYSTAIHSSNKELLLAKKSQIPVIHRSDLLQRLLEKKPSLLVSGAHGKTTTSALLAWVLRSAHLDPSFVIGGLLKPEMENGHKGHGQYFVAEADESDGSFLNLSYTGAILTNYDFDHVDFWKTEENLKQAYQKFIKKALNPKWLFLCADDPFFKSLNFESTSFGFSEKADYQILNYRQVGLRSVYDVKWKTGLAKDIVLNLPGEHYALNATAVFGLCVELGLDIISILKGLKTFPGVKRRLDYLGSKDSVDIFNDYAHHPKEIKTLITTLKTAYPERRLVSVFQPHRYTRLQAMAEDFAKALAGSDKSIITDVYSAGEQPLDKEEFPKFLNKAKKYNSSSFYFQKNELIENLRAVIREQDVIVFMGAGDISTHAVNFLMEHQGRKLEKEEVASI